MPHSIPEIPVVYFHSIAPQKDPKWVRNFLTLELHYFESFLKYLKKHQWEAIFLNEYHQIRNSGIKPTAKLCCLTFDDGFLDNYIYAFPLLKKYGFKGTVFVNPEFVDLKRSVAKTLEDVWANNATFDTIDQGGYLTWDELRLMQQSGVIDVQSHTLTHTKHFISDEIVTFHHPGDDCLYPIGNLFPERKPYYYLNREFENLIPYGTPFFKSSSAVTAHRVLINPKFNEKIVEIMDDFEWNQPNALEKAFEKVNPEFLLWKNKNKIIEEIENNDDYERRLSNEIVRSKEIIENELNKKVEFLCWPHGDNNLVAHNMAIDSGYKMTTIGKAPKTQLNQHTRISERMGINFSGAIKTIKTKFKLKAFAGIFPYSSILDVYRK
jgi:hypothetical protein